MELRKSKKISKNAATTKEPQEKQQAMDILKEK